MLAESGIRGRATLDLVFDSRGEVDENRSRFSGGHKLLRGLLVGAVREGLVAWYLNDAANLRIEQYRGQHFRAEFDLNAAVYPVRSVRNLAPNSYEFLRKRRSANCVAPGLGGSPMMDLACVALSAYGAIRRETSADYRSRLQGLRDHLEELDRRGLQGFGELLDARRG
ncbi:MAG: hypothetical protein IT285_06035 [Bdellovibrionales bacterium]|nr:hypothetical protein [Bdellovibrionales bacterium]